MNDTFVTEPISNAYRRQKLAEEIQAQGYTRTHGLYLANILIPQERVTSATTTRRTKKGSKAAAANGRKAK